jgi:hypothetical protein
MPLSNRRRARRKDIQLQETSDAEAPDSSPTRPSNKKRKVRSQLAKFTRTSYIFPSENRKILCKLLFGLLLTHGVRTGR